MFAPPPEVTAEVFARLPDELAGDPSTSEWAKVQHAGKNIPAFFEGPSFDRDGNLYIVDIAYGRILRVTPDAEFEVVCDYDGEPNGLKIHKDGTIYIADHKNGIMCLDPNTGKIEPFLDRPHLQRFIGVNDLHFTMNGDLWFTDQGQSGLQNPNGRLYRLCAEDGRLEAVLDNVPSPNGLVPNRDESQMMLAATRGNNVWRVRFMPDKKTTAKTGVFIQLSGGTAGPDGLALDDKGNLVVCHMGLGTVWLFSEIGEPILRIRSPEGIMTSNCAFGGLDRKYLYITESHNALILRVEMPHPGAPMFAHM
ncbi:MAG: SMP-30/gluconolactonase/LRE family protein [Rhodospirillaceae bacterium]|jgi:gluconolactonase|nr:SMP-30/gluconolactonase/LRE family protein [Rhodospirillaceae bacterium]